jgi:hypothetical protein
MDLNRPLEVFLRRAWPLDAKVIAATSMDAREAGCPVEELVLRDGHEIKTATFDDFLAIFH